MANKFLLLLKRSEEIHPQYKHKQSSKTASMAKLGTLGEKTIVRKFYTVGSDYYTVIWLPYSDKKYSDFSKNLYYNKTILLQRVTQFTFLFLTSVFYLYYKAKLQPCKDHISRTNLFIVASTVCLFQRNNMGNIGKNDMLLCINIIQI